MAQRWTTFFAMAVLVVATVGVGTAQQESIEEIRARAEAGDAAAQNDLVLAYANGEGVPEDDVTAHMWFDLAASRFTGIDREGVVKSRDQLAATLPAHQLAEATRLAREWDEAPPRD